MSNSSPPRVVLVETENSIIYSGEEVEEEKIYNLYDILWSDGKATQEVRPVSDGVVPIGLCVIPTNWLGEGEKARFIALKYMTDEMPCTPGPNGECGSLDMTYLRWGCGYGEGSPVPYNDPEEDPLIQYYVPFMCKSSQTNEDIIDSALCSFEYDDKSQFKDIRIKENWQNILNYCKENPGKYAIGDINGKQNTINISIEGNINDGYDKYNNATHEHPYHPDMKLSLAQYAPPGTIAGEWYVPALGELLQFTARLYNNDIGSSINDILDKISKMYSEHCITPIRYDYYYYSSTVYNENYCYFAHGSARYIDINTYYPRSYYGGVLIAFLQR